MTPNMESFIKANKLSKIVQGEHLTPEGRNIMTIKGMERSDRTEYTLENGKRFTITFIDKQSSDGYVPDWLC